MGWQRTKDVQMELLQRGPRHSKQPVDLVASAAFVVGGLFMIWSAYIHFHLYDSVGYKSIHIIGPLFLLQAIAGLVLGLAVMAVRRVGAAVIGAGFAVSTMVGFLISVSHGLFNFKESWSAPFAHQAFAIEIATIVIFIIAGALCLAGSAPTSTTVTTPAGTSA
jgi:hypothetical protein